MGRIEGVLCVFLNLVYYLNRCCGQHRVLYCVSDFRGTTSDVDINPSPISYNHITASKRTGTGEMGTEVEALIIPGYTYTQTVTPERSQFHRVFSSSTAIAFVSNECSAPEMCMWWTRGGSFCIQSITNDQLLRRFDIRGRRQVLVNYVICIANSVIFLYWFQQFLPFWLSILFSPFCSEKAWKLHVTNLGGNGEIGNFPTPSIVWLRIFSIQTILEAQPYRRTGLFRTWGVEHCPGQHLPRSWQVWGLKWHERGV